ncbi:MAG: choice-of-anchor tandem repeat GloVer-containing protein [Candidatus Binataceae bacterium]
MYFFTAAIDGSTPTASLILDRHGKLYGPTQLGGKFISSICRSGCGTVFALTPPATAGGSWTEHVLYKFLGGTADGADPAGALVADKNGAFYGTTVYGGIGATAAGGGAGTVFKLTPAGGGQWTEGVLHYFTGSPDGGFPAAALLHNNHELFGTTVLGGGTNQYGLPAGTVFEVTP